MGDALTTAMEIKYLGMSFASKVLAFMDCEKAAVYDAVISERLAVQADHTLRSLAVSTSTAPAQKRGQAEIYAEWCNWCSTRAGQLNSAGLRWRDWDRSPQGWRAIDVERAFFALGR